MSRFHFGCAAVTQGVESQFSEVERQTPARSAHKDLLRLRSKPAIYRVPVQLCKGSPLAKQSLACESLRLSMRAPEARRIPSLDLVLFNL